MTPAEDGRRLRNVLRGSMGISYSVMKSAKWGGRILLNGDPAFVDARVRAGDRVDVVFPEKKPEYEVTPYEMDLIIPFEDDRLMVIDKLAGIASQGSAENAAPSLENAVYSHLGCPEGYIYRPVNRLDKGTGGLMAVAKDAHTQYRMQEMLHTESFRREYLAMCDGVPEPREGCIDAPIGKADGATVKREVRADGKPSRTLYRVIAEKDGRALIRLKLETGRTHQIRVHLASVGCPVTGDFLYGTERPDEFPGHFALHSAFLTFIHPDSGKELTFESIPDWAEKFDFPIDMGYHNKIQ